MISKQAESLNLCRFSTISLRSESRFESLNANYKNKQEVYNRIKKGQYSIEGNSFEKEKYDDVQPAELFFAVDFMRRSHPTPFFHRKPKDEQLFDKNLQSIYKLIKAFMQK